MLKNQTTHHQKKWLESFRHYEEAAPKNFYEYYRFTLPIRLIVSYQYMWIDIFKFIWISVDKTKVVKTLAMLGEKKMLFFDK